MTISVTFACTLFFLHWLSDFKFQPDWMGTGKAKSWWILLHHVVRYTVTVTAGVAAWQYLDGTFRLVPVAQFAGATFVLHFLTDAVTSRITAYLWFIDLQPRPAEELGVGQFGHYRTYPYYARVRDTRHGFFVTIGFDQFLHAVALLGAAGWYL